MRRPRTILPLATALLVALSGCFGDLGRPPRPPASAIWLAAETPAPEPGALSRLRSLGIGELFLEAGRIEAGALERVPAAELPSGTAVTLVVTGSFGEARSIAAESLVSELRQLAFEAESRGLVPVGLHFDIVDADDLGAYAELLSAIARAQSSDLFLSCSLPQPWLARAGVEDIVSAVDAVVAFLYGQRPQEAEDPSQWDFTSLERNLARLESFGQPYFLGLGTIGLAFRMSQDGESTTRASLRQFFSSGDFGLEPGFSLEGINRMVFTLKAERGMQVGDWALGRGERVRIVRPAASHLEEIDRLRGAWQVPNLLGSVYYRIPESDEGLSLDIETLIAALEPTPATPRISVDATLQRATGRGFLYRFSVRNEGPGTTELSVLDSNILEVTVSNGSVGRVGAGDFERFALFDRGADGSLAATFRSADTVQLHLPVLEDGTDARTGDVEIIADEEPILTVEARFMLPDGRTIRTDPKTWQGGRPRSGATP